MRVAILMQQTLLGGHESSGTINVDRATFQHHVNMTRWFALGLQPLCSDFGVIVIRRELVTPAVESPAGALALSTVSHVDGPAVAKPRVVNSQRHHINGVSA